VSIRSFFLLLLALRRRWHRAGGHARALVDVHHNPAGLLAEEQAGSRAALQQAHKQAGLKVGMPATLLLVCGISPA
jgi:hypothetical protein